MKWSQVEQLFHEAMGRLGNPPITLLRPYEMERRGVRLGSFWGKCKWIRVHSAKGYIIEDAQISVAYQKRTKTEMRDTIYHEIAHALFPKKPHWWIECYAYKLAHSRGRYGRYTRRYGHSPRELPLEEELVKRSREVAQRLNAMPRETPEQKMERERIMAEQKRQSLEYVAIRDGINLICADEAD